MRYLERRIRNLEEAYGRDSRGMFPGTPTWMEQRLARAQRIYDGVEELRHGEKIPFDVMRAFMQSTDS